MIKNYIVLYDFFTQSVCIMSFILLLKAVDSIGGILLGNLEKSLEIGQPSWLARGGLRRFIVVPCFLYLVQLFGRLAVFAA